MEQRGQGVRRQLGLIAVACVVLVCSAAPVMADPAEPSASPEGDVLQASEYGTPSPESIAAAHQAAMREEEERERELQEQPFITQRESSRHAYVDATPTEAEELLLSTFGETLASLNAEPARLLSDVKLDQNLGEGSAVITDEGRHEILEAGMPIEARNAEGETEKVDLSLEEGPDGFEPENPVTEVSIGKTAEEGVEVGDEGLTVTQAGAEKSTGRLLGDKNVFFGEVEAGSDTDLMVSPTAHGAELFDMLRSIDSPETLRFELELPAGETLRAAPGGGAEIVDAQGSIVGMVPKPHGEDAQGTYIPVKLEVEGDTIVLHIESAKEDIAYPALIDPDIFTSWGWWYAGQNLQGTGYWGWGSNIWGDRPLPVGETPWAGSWAGGLFAEIGTGETNAGNYAAFYLNAPNTNVYLHDVEINPYYMFVGEGWPYREPYDFEGYVDVVQHHWNEIDFEQARNLGRTQHIPTMWGHQYEWGMEVDVNSYSPAYWRYLAAGGVAFQMGDWGPPTLTSVGSGPSQWITSSTPFSVYASATDEGLGVKYISFTPGGTSTPIEKWAGCQGTYESRCPTSYGNTFSFTGAGFSEGERQVQVSAQDVTLKGSNTGTFTLKVDQRPPELQLHGQLMAAVNEAGAGEAQGQGGPELSQPLYNLKIDATDGVFGTTDPIAKRSGVKKIEVLLEGALQQTYSNASCPASSCELHATYPLKLTGLTAGVHKLEVKAYDFAGNQPQTRQIEFEYMPATGISEDFILQRFPLPDGKNHSGEAVSHGPELAVNVMNGNVVYHQRDVNVEGPAADLEVELFYNSQLPKEQSSEWGRGWTLSQTPRLEKVFEGGGTSTGRGVTTRAVITGGVELPQESGQAHFSNKLNAVVTKQASGGYTVSEETDNPGSTTVYNAAGQTTEVQTSPTASVEYAYNSGKLSEIAVNDPGSTTSPPRAQKPAPSIVPTYVSSFGSTGSANGQFGHPADVALDPSGKLWVADANNNRLKEFTKEGDFIKSLGSTGTGSGQFTSPKSLAFAANGSLWVADAGNSRLEQFHANGGFLKAVGSQGSGNGQFNRPEGVAIAPNGHIWVADTYNYRIVELDEEGNFVKVLNPPGLGAIEPTGIDVGPEGNVWVADWAHNRVVELSPAGELIKAVGAAGSGNGQFSHPDAIAVGAHGEVWVGDQSNNRVQELNAEGTYVTQFGSVGAGPGQFSFSYPLGIATDNQGSLWVTDTNNNRVQRWLIPHYAYKPVYVSSYGQTGTGNGQFSHPGDVAVDSAGNLWVPDTENNRLEELRPNGEFIKAICSTCAVKAQFSRPKSIAFTADGNFWVADAGNSRLQEFTEGGGLIKTAGSGGSGNGQFNGPESLAIAPNGHIWVSDTYNYRIQELDEDGNFIKVVNPPGLGAIEPTGLAFGPGGNAWVSDWSHNRVVELSPTGNEVVRQFGSRGEGNGQFRNPDEIAVDGRGIVWVGDQNNNRVQGFDESGNYLTQFGSAGSGAGQFSLGYPTGIAADSKGSLWVADSRNNRIQRWMTGARVPAEEETAPVKDDPAVAVQTTSGLVSKVSGPQAGQRTYSHEGELLTSDQGPEGTTTYKYDASARLTKVTLPNGTIAEVVYDTTGRATKVTVDPAGAEPAKSTNISYTEESGTESRKTTVEPEGQRRTFYMTGNDGSVLRWWNAEVPPTFNKEVGTLVEKREKELGIGDQTLTIEGHAAEGVSKIEFIVNGSNLVDERTYTGTRQERENEQLQWIVNTEELAAGTMWIEAVITDSLNNVATKRWWVTVPYIPPPPPGVPQPPRYKDVLHFREEMGLDLDLDPVLNELELHERVIETLGAWHNPQTPLGEVAYAAYERWGVPLRPADVAELEYREAYVAHDGPLIEAWAEANAQNTYAGYYVDNRAGGIIQVGFTENAAGSLAQLRGALQLLAPEKRVAAYTAAHGRSRVSLEGSIATISTAWSTNPTLSSDMTELTLNTRTNIIEVGAENIGHVQEVLIALVGAEVPLSLHYSASRGEFDGRYRTQGKMLAGDEIQSSNERCTAGPGAYKTAGTKQNGEVIKGTRFLIVAGHCAALGEDIYRGVSVEAKMIGAVKIGRGARTGLPRTGGYETDGSAVVLENPTIVPNAIFRPDRPALPVHAPDTLHEGDDLCFSGVKTGQIKCGPVLGFWPFRPGRKAQEPQGPIGVLMSAEMGKPFVTEEGDSGAPVWDAQTKAIVGMVSGREHGHSMVAPLLPLRIKNAANRAPGVLAAIGGDLTIEAGE